MYAYAATSLLKSVVLGVLVVTVLTIGLEVRGFKPGREQWSFKDTARLLSEGN